MGAPAIDLDGVEWTQDDNHVIRLLCPGCASDVPVAITGRLRPHNGQDGGPCSHNGAHVQRRAVAA